MYNQRETYNCDTTPRRGYIRDTLHLNHLDNFPFLIHQHDLILFRDDISLVTGYLLDKLVAFPQRTAYRHEIEYIFIELFDK